MPIIEAGFGHDDGRPDIASLITYGPTVVVNVGTYLTDDDVSERETETVHALIDTGATQSCIDNKLAEKLELPIVDICNIAGASGESLHNVYLARVDIPDLTFYQYGKFTGVNLTEGGQQHQALLGRTFLQNTIMIYDGIRGHVTVVR